MMSQNKPIEQLVERLFNITRDYKHEYVTLEHLLMVLLENDVVQDIIYDLEQDPTDISKTLNTNTAIIGTMGTGNLAIGSSNAGARQWDGTIREVKIFDTELTAEEIGDL